MHDTDTRGTTIHQLQPADEHEYGPEVPLAERLEHEQLLLAAS